MLIVIIAALLGIWRYRSREYFKWVGITAVWMLLGGFLFAGGGTLEDPSGDGIIAHQIRIATNDGPGMGLFAIVFLVVYWGGVIFFISRMVKAARAVREADELAFDDHDFEPSDNTGRKALETAALLLVAALWGWFAFIRPATDRYEALTATEPDQPQPTPTGLTIEQEVLGAAAEVNASAPQQVDEATTLVRATATGRNLTYHYRIEATAADRENLMSFLHTNVVPKTCTGELRPYMREDGVSYTYSYVGSDFTEPVEITVDEALCAGLEG